MKEVAVYLNKEQIHDYTELVIEIWDAYAERGYALSDLAGGDSRDGIDYVARMAIRFLEEVKLREEQGWWWDGGWIEAVQDYAQRLIENHPPALGWNPAHEVVLFMEPPEDRV